MIRIEIEDAIARVAPQLHVLTIEADVTNGDTPDELWTEIQEESGRLRDTLPMEGINKRPAILATRQAYKALGKEPNRYRPSAEALCRRLVKGMELYRVNMLVDLINLVSVRTGYSIGGFDAGKFDGDLLRLGVGREGEDFEAIGRGQLNIACMPVYRDNTGGVGTPTSDNERTKLDNTTSRLLMVVNMYGEEMTAAETEEWIKSLLEKYASTRNIIVNHYRP